MHSDDKLPHKTPEVLPLGATFSPQVLALGSFVLAILLLIVFVFFRRQKSGSKGDALLLLGPSDAGKTALMSKLVYNHTLPTQTSMQVNIAKFTLNPQKSIRVIDIPGHPRLRGQFQEFLPQTRAIAFLVDPSTISRNGAEVAEHLHHVLHALTSLPPSQKQPALLILATKYDLLKTGSASANSPGNLAINRIKTILERELEKRRKSQAGGIHVEGLGEEGETAELGGLVCGEKEDSPFKFDEWEGGEVTFLATSTGSDSKGLETLWEWLEGDM